MSGKDINIPFHSRALPGYMAEPLDGQKPGVVVIGAIFGVDDDIKAITERLATNGYPATPEHVLGGRRHRCPAGVA